MTTWSGWFASVWCWDIWDKRLDSGRRLMYGFQTGGRYVHRRIRRAYMTPTTLLRKNLFLFVVAVCSLPTLASAQPADSPLIRQVALDTDGASFVELINPAGATLDLTNVYLASVTDYYRIAEGVYGGTEDHHFLVRFPNATRLAAGDTTVILVGGEASEFLATWGVPADFSAQATPDDAGTAAMELPTPGAYPVAPPAADGAMVLFYWDGASDLVVDLDIFFWGTGVNVDKTGVAIDGPDADGDTTSYADDTAVVSQRPAATLTENMALRRVGDEGVETTPGNGLGGEDDETSEDLSGGVALQEISPVLDHDVTVSGTVVAGARSPNLEGLTIEFLESDQQSAVATTDETGAFTTTLVAARTYDVRITGDGILETEDELVVRGLDISDVQFTVDGPYVIGGVVSPGAGTPEIAGLTIAVTGLGLSLDLDETGEFAFTVNGPGEYELVVDGEGIVAATESVTVGDEGVEDLVIVVDAGYGVTGVVSGNAEVVVAAEVRVVELDLTVLTDDLGAFDLGVLPVGTYNLTVTAEGFEPFERTLDVMGALELDLVLDPIGTGVLSVTVQTSDGGSNEGAFVAVGPPRGLPTATAEIEGGAPTQFSGLDDGNYRVEVQLAGYHPLTISTVPVSENTPGLEVVLVPVTRQPAVTEIDCSVAPSSIRGTAVWWSLGLLAVVLFVRRCRA